YRALYERARTRETRGRMGLALALHRRAEANLGERLALRGTDPSRWDAMYLGIWDPAYIEQLRRAEPRTIRRQAEVILERVRDDYGDVRSRDATGLRPETLATLAGIELAESRSVIHQFP